MSPLIPVKKVLSIAFILFFSMYGPVSAGPLKNLHKEYPLEARDISDWFRSKRIIEQKKQA